MSFLLYMFLCSLFLKPQMEFPPKKRNKIFKKGVLVSNVVVDTYLSSFVCSVKVVRYLDFFSFSKSSLTVSSLCRRSVVEGLLALFLPTSPSTRCYRCCLAEELLRFEEELFLSRRERLTGRRVLSTPPREK